jgi:hypothetical protein
LDHEQVLADFAAAKEEGSRLVQQKKADEGCLMWQDAAVDVDEIVESSKPNYMFEMHVRQTLTPCVYF